jgi:hypothetical protein
MVDTVYASLVGTVRICRATGALSVAEVAASAGRACGARPRAACAWVHSSNEASRAPEATRHVVKEEDFMEFVTS